MVIPEGFLHNRFHIWKGLAVTEFWQPVQTYNCIYFFAGSFLAFRVEKHCKQKYTECPPRLDEGLSEDKPKSDFTCTYSLCTSCINGGRGFFEVFKIIRGHVFLCGSPFEVKR